MGPKTAMRRGVRYKALDSYSLAGLEQCKGVLPPVMGEMGCKTDLLRTRPFGLFVRSCAFPVLLARLVVVP